MNLVKHGTFAAALLLSASAMADINGYFVGGAWGQTTADFNRSATLKANHGEVKFDRILRGKRTLMARAGLELDQDSDFGPGRFYLSYDNVSNDRHGWYLRQENLLLSWDARVAIGETTSLFGGLSAGLTRMELNPTGLRKDTTYGFAGGVQAGLLQELPNNFQLEGGIRFLVHNDSVRIRDRDLGGQGDARLKQSRLAYVGVNYRF